MLESIKNAYKAAKSRRQTVRELSQLTDRELRDLGIARCDIQQIARRGTQIV